MQRYQYINNLYYSLLGGFLSGAYVRGAFVLDPLYLFTCIASEVKCSMGTASGLKKNWNNVDPCSSGNLWLSAPENVLITSINNTGYFVI